MSSKTRITVLLAACSVAAFTLIGGYLGRVSAGEDTYRHLRVFEDVVSLISNNYVEEVNLDEVMDGALRGLAEGLDSDSAYLAPEDADRIERGGPLPDGRVGLEITRRYYLQVIAPLEASPADEANILPGDFVRAINGQPTRHLSAVEGQRLLRGEPGTEVTLSLIRGSTQEPYDITLTREAMTPPAAAGRMLADEGAGIGYLRIPDFGDTSATGIADAVAALEGNGATHLIVDIRGTAEGTYGGAVEAARLFVADGAIAIREEPGDAQEIIEAGNDGAATIALPVTLLTNYGTSGPAEVFAAALLDRDRATSVGQQTSGRTGLQRLVRLPDGAGLWISWARYVRPSGDGIHPFGLQPDVPVQVTPPELGEPLPDEDVVLDRAVEEITDGSEA